jgi:putative SOS response-associated peptidase YedK
MCGRLTQKLSAAEIAELFGAEARVDDAGEHYNLAPTQPVRAVVDRGGQRVVDTFRWGLIPGWADDPRIGSRMFNARAETVAEKPAFRSAFRRQRCIVPADFFYEWQTRRRTKQPYAIGRKDGRPLALAGLWAIWRGPDEQTIPSCTVITTAANQLLAPLHDRMPVILPEEAWADWLDPQEQDPLRLQANLVPYPDDRLILYPVSPLVNNVREDGPRLLEPVG